MGAFSVQIEAIRHSSLNSEPQIKQIFRYLVEKHSLAVINKNVVKSNATY